ncbi:MAG: extracellular solute-binding protein [Gammaproteobacteria bacterium]|nr:extracellular solute-binding protein [Gammaproteobacteria bacterium]
MIPIRRTLAVLACCLSLVACGSPDAPERRAETVRVFNWSDYIAADTLARFSAETGLRTVYDVFDSQEVLEARLLSGASGYDVVVPSSDAIARQIGAEAFQPLQRERLSNYVNLDPELLGFLETVDPGNAYGVPYLWGTTGIGVNVAMLEARFPEGAPADSLDLLFVPENVERLADCGVALLDSAAEVFPLVLNYLGLEPNSAEPADYQGPVRDAFMAIRPHIRYFHSSQYINDLANGEICVALGWSGDILQAADRAAEAGRGVEIEYAVPAEGSSVWFDLLAIPRDAGNVEGAHAFIDFLLRPEVIAEVSNTVFYANPNLPATALLAPEVREHPGIYPPPEVRARLFAVEAREPALDRVMTRVWTEIKTRR